MFGVTTTVYSATPNLAWPTGVEDFENVSVGTASDAAITGWVIVDSAVPAEYTSEVANTPAAHPNQAGGSTKWITITDGENSSSALGRTYSNTITAPLPVSVSKYRFKVRIDVQALGTSGPLILAQHQNNSSAFANAAGLEVTASGVNLIIVGTTDGGLGKAGASTRTLLYNYADAGGFGMNAWIPVEFEFDIANGNLNGTATGTDGATVKNA